jgi:brefeldin A-inhibited guanine nucleotide-exchange protein
VESGLIKKNDAKDAAKFFLTTDGLSKAMIGEYLGEGFVINSLFSTISLILCS